MDRREIQSQQSQSQSQIAPHGMFQNSYNHNHNNNNNSSMLMIPNSSSNMIPNPRWDFNPMISPKKFETFNNLPYDGQESGFGMMHCGLNTMEQQQVEETKKKRGRPKKNSPDGGNIALGLSSSSPVSPVDGNETPVKRGRGRPAGSGKKQLDALGPGGVGFTPHVVLIQPGEDIALKILAFSQQGPRTICILSANGAICNVTLRQSDRTVTYEGRFEIISLSGSFSPSENDGNTSKKGGLCVSLAASDGRVLGGEVAGMLVAATQMQVIMGSFVAEGKKAKLNISSTSTPTPSSATPLQILNFGAPVLAASPPSHGGGSSDSSHDNGSSPLDQAGGFSGPYRNNANQNQPITHGMPLYPSMNWVNNSGMNIHPN